MNARRKTRRPERAGSAIETEEAVKEAFYILFSSRHSVVGLPTEDLAELARNGWPYAHRVLCEKAQALTKAGAPLPLELQKYVVEKASAIVPKRKDGPGRSKYENFARNIQIRKAIEHLVKRGIRPTRDPKSQRRESACSIVHKALIRGSTVQKTLKRGRRQVMDEKAIEKIWQHKHKHGDIPNSKQLRDLILITS
jgi:hypothetical protein